jgi:hypothetical protein
MLLGRLPDRGLFTKKNPSQHGIQQEVFFQIYVNIIRSEIDKSDLIYAPCVSKCHTYLICYQPLMQ